MKILVAVLLLRAMVSATAQEARPDFASITKATVRLHVVGRASGEAGEEVSVDRYATGFFVGEAGWLLTAYHTLLRSDAGGTLRWNSRPKISVEHFDERIQALVPLPQDAFIQFAWEQYDAALLSVQARQSGVKCSSAVARDDLAVFAIGWRKDQATPDRLEGRLAPAPAWAALRYKIVRMAPLRGNSGGPVFAADGTVIGLISSGRDSVLIPGADETFVTRLADLATYLPADAQCAGNDGA